MKQTLWVALAWMAMVGCSGNQPKPEVAGENVGSGDGAVGSEAGTATAQDPEAGAGEAVAAEGASADAEVQTLYVASELVDCTGEGPMKCMKIKRSKDGEWELFYSKIEGFEFAAGKDYELKVEARPRPNPPAGGSSVRYKLLEVVRGK